MVARKSRAGRYGPVALVMALGLATLGSGHLGPAVRAQASRPEAVKSLRLYVFELGNIPVDKGNMFKPPIEVAAGGCCIIVGHLIVHPKGTLIWDTGLVPDALIGSKTPGAERYTGKPFSAKLAEVGYRPEDITYLGLSHYHGPHGKCQPVPEIHVGSCRRPSATRCLRKQIPGGSQPDPSHYSALKTSKAIVLANIPRVRCVWRWHRRDQGCARAHRGTADADSETAEDGPRDAGGGSVSLPGGANSASVAGHPRFRQGAVASVTSDD